MRVSVPRRWTWFHPPHGLCKTKRLSLRVAAPASARPTARAFARAGAAVGVNYRSKASAAEELVREIRDQGGEAIALKADVSRDDEVRAMFDWLVEAFGRIDILVANAGIQKDAAITNMSLEDWRAVLDINLTGQFLCVREAIRANNALCPRLELTRNVGYHRSGSWIHHCTAERRPHQPSPRAPRVKPQGGRKPRALRGAARRMMPTSGRELARFASQAIWSLRDASTGG